MDVAFWQQVWTLFMSAPVIVLGLVVLIAGSAGSLAWWFRGVIADERLAVREERLAQARENAERLQARLAEAEQKIAQLTKQIEQGDQQETVLATVNRTAEIFRDLSAANTALQTTLNPDSGAFRVEGGNAGFRVLPLDKSKKRS